MKHCSTFCSQQSPSRCTWSPHALQGILAYSSHNLAHRSGGRNNIPVSLLLRDTGDNLLDIFSLSIIEICFNGDRRPWKGLEPPVCPDLCPKACPTAMRPPVSLIIRLNEALRLLDVLLTTQFILHVIDEKLLLQVNHLRAVNLIGHSAL